MRAVDEAALICDFAEFYHIYDWEQFPLKRQAILACGLPESARIIRKLTKQKAPLDTVLLMAVVDSIREFEYSYVSAHSKKKPKKPESLLSAFQNDKPKDVQAYDSAEDFEQARAKIIGENNGG